MSAARVRRRARARPARVRGDGVVAGRLALAALARGALVWQPPSVERRARRGDGAGARASSPRWAACWASPAGSRAAPLLVARRRDPPRRPGRVARWLAPATSRRERAGERARGAGASAGPAPLPCLLPLFVLALYPPTAFDETLYHLPFARAFAAHRRPAVPARPALPGLPAARRGARRRDAAGRRRRRHAPACRCSPPCSPPACSSPGARWTAGPAARRRGWWRPRAWLGNPIVVYLAGTGYVEPLLALFVTAALHAFWRWRREGGGGWLALAATFAGAAAATKYLGLFFVVALALAALAARRRRRAGARMRRLAGGAPRASPLRRRGGRWRWRPGTGGSSTLTGNPVFPYLSGIFGANAWMPVRFRTLCAVAARRSEASRRPLRPGGWLTLPWDVVARAPSSSAACRRSRRSTCSALPLSLWSGVRERRLRRLLAAGGGFVAALPAAARRRALPGDRAPAALEPGGSAAAAASRRAIGARPATRAALWAWRSRRRCPAGLALRRLPSRPAGTAADDGRRPRGIPAAQRAALPGRALGSTARRPARRHGLRALRRAACATTSAARFLGDWYGPHRYADPRRRPRQARGARRARSAAWSVDFLLVARRKAAGTAFVDARPRGRFELIYTDDGGAALRCCGRRSSRDQQTRQRQQRWRAVMGVEGFRHVRGFLADGEVADWRALLGAARAPVPRGRRQGRPRPALPGDRRRPDPRRAAGDRRARRPPRASAGARASPASRCSRSQSSKRAMRVQAYARRDHGFRWHFDGHDYVALVALENGNGGQTHFISPALSRWLRFAALSALRLPAALLAVPLRGGDDGARATCW